MQYDGAMGCMGRCPQGTLGGFWDGAWDTLKDWGDRVREDFGDFIEGALDPIADPPADRRVPTTVIVQQPTGGVAAEPAGGGGVSTQTLLLVGGAALAAWLLLK